MYSLRSLNTLKNADSIGNTQVVKKTSGARAVLTRWLWEVVGVGARADIGNSE